MTKMFKSLPLSLPLSEVRYSAPLRTTKASRRHSCHGINACYARNMDFITQSSSMRVLLTQVSTSFLEPSTLHS